METAATFAGFLAGLKYEDIPAPALETAEQILLDYIGNSLGGSSDPAIMTLSGLLQTMGGEPQCTVIGQGIKLSAPDAAQLNATMGFALDYDDTHDRGNIHLGVSCIPAALAAAELSGKDGKSLLTAIVGGMELATRLGVACKRKIPRHIMGGWDYAALHGCFSSAAVAGLLLDLDENQLLNALGIAYQQAAGNTLSAIEEADTKKLGPGFAARNGLMSALMAKAGLTGCRSVFTGTQYSLFSMYHDGGDPDKLVEGLGRDYLITETGFKPYPCCRLGHGHIDALMELMRANCLIPEDVISVELEVCPPVDIQLCSPAEAKRSPLSKNAAQFSLPWMSACAIVRCRLGVAEFSPEALKDTALLAMAARVTTRVNNGLKNELTPASVTLKTTKGSFTRLTASPYGSTQNPMSRDSMEAKFRSNAAICAVPIPDARLEKLLGLLTDPSGIESIHLLTKLL